LEEAVEGGAAVEDEVVAVFDLTHAQPVPQCPGPGGLVQAGQILLQQRFDGGGNVLRAEGIGQLLQACRVGAGGEGVIGFAKSNALGGQTVRQPVVAVQPEAHIEREVGTDAQEDAAALRMVQVEIIESDPTTRDIDVVPASGIADRDPLGLTAATATSTSSRSGETSTNE
jgi:hypothetical protein